jgi:hypothetical protein
MHHACALLNDIGAPSRIRLAAETGTEKRNAMPSVKAIRRITVDLDLNMGFTVRARHTSMKEL